MKFIKKERIQVNIYCCYVSTDRKSWTNNWTTLCIVYWAHTNGVPKMSTGPHSTQTYHGCWSKKLGQGATAVPSSLRSDKWSSSVSACRQGLTGTCAFTVSSIGTRTASGTTPALWGNGIVGWGWPGPGLGPGPGPELAWMKSSTCNKNNTPV